MHRSLISLFLFASLAGPATAELDLTATRSEYVGEGIVYQRLVFKDGKRQVSMPLPSGWTSRSSATRLHLTPSNAEFAEGVVEAARLEAPLPPWDEAALRALTHQAMSNVPPGSQGVALVSEQHNNVVLGGTHLSYEVIVSYKSLGRTFKRGTIFINLPGDQLVCRLTAPESDFDRLNGTFQSAIRSWTWSQ